MNSDDLVKKLREENDLLRQELGERSDFLSLVIHQLRTPLTASKWTLHMACNGDFGTLNDQGKIALARTYESNEQMIRMLAEISQAHHLGEWKLSLNPRPMDISHCITHALDAFKPEARMRAITLHYNPETNPPLVIADPERICIVIQNLIENAIKYNRRGGTVSLATETKENHLIIMIHDTGIGIPHDAQRSLFTKFFRAENAKKTYQGTGLGLYVAKQIIDLHHGSLWVESIENVGSTFFISLPLVQGTHA